MTSAPPPNDGSHVGPDSAFDGVLALLESKVGSVFPSASLYVADRGVRVLQAHVGACNETTLFDLASLTKPLSTTLLCMRLLDQDRIGLDDEVRPGTTVRQLLAHASGLPAVRALGANRADVVDAVYAEPLESRPWTRSLYSDLGFILLGDAVEMIGGERLDTLFKHEVSGPLFVANDLRFGAPAERAAPTGNGALGVVHDDNARAMDGVAGHAGLFGTADAVARVVHDLVGAWAGGSGLVSSETVRLFWSASGVPDSTWCLGWDRPAAVGSSAGTRWPRDGVGHLAFTGCSLWIDPARARYIVLLTNRVALPTDHEAIKLFRPQLHDLIVEALDGPAAPPAESP